MLRLAAPLGLALILAVPALAAPVDDLARALGDARATGQPVFDVFRELAVTLPQGKLDAADIRAAVAKAGLKDSEALAKFFAGATSLVREGDRITITRPETVGVPLENDRGEADGWMWLLEEATFRARRDGAVVIVDDFDDVKLSEKKDSMRGKPYEIRYEVERGRRIARLKAGRFLIHQTSVIDLEPAPTPGAAGSVPGGR
jgi:hypothetical protein